MFRTTPRYEIKSQNLQVLFQPFELIGYLFPSIIDEEVKFRTQGDEMSWTNVKAENDKMVQKAEPSRNQNIPSVFGPFGTVSGFGELRGC